MERADRPVTVDDIETALRQVGVTAGSTVIVHCSLSRLGWVVGSAVAVVRALESVVGPAGTIVMPAHTGIGDPSHWEAPPVPEAWWPTIRQTWPAFDPALTPMRQMGAVAECFSRQPGVVHDNNTSLHLAETRALGADAPMVVDGVPLVVDGDRRWVEYTHVDYDASDFAVVGEADTAEGGSEWKVTLGAGEVRRIPIRELVDFATRWIAEHRPAAPPEPR